MTSHDAVLAAAQRCLNVDPAASMAQIATAAGIGRATLHRHFASREVLIHEIGRRSLDRWQESLAAVAVADVAADPDPERVRAALIDLLTRFVADLEDYGVTLTDAAVNNAPLLRERVAELFAQEITLYAAAQEAGVLRADLSARWIGHAVYGLLVAVRDALLFGDIARRDAVELMRTSVLDGMAVR